MMKQQTTEPFLAANYHTHTPRCGHAGGTEREYIENAIRAGIRTLGFADHAPYPFPKSYRSGMRMEVEETEAYTQTLCELREEYKNDIRILIGYETEYYPAYFDAALRNICAYPVDYLIMGQHFLDNEITRVYVGAKTEDETILVRYVSQVIAGLETGVFSYLAHPDLPHFTGDSKVYDTQMRRLCERAKQLDIPLEINFLGLKEHRWYPYSRFWEIVRETDNRVIFGCDAHQPDMLSDKHTLCEALSYAEKLGIHPSQELVLRDPHLYLQR